MPSSNPTTEHRDHSDSTTNEQFDPPGTLELPVPNGPITVPVDEAGELYPLGKTWLALRPTVQELQLALRLGGINRTDRLLAALGIDAGRLGRETVAVVDELGGALDVYREIDEAYPDAKARYWPVDALAPELQAEVRHSVAPFAQALGYDVPLAETAEPLAVRDEGGEA